MKCFVLFIDRVISKIQRTYRNYVFFAKTGCRASLVGNMTLINRNIKCGKNVTIYPDVMFFGDGRIEIGDNVDIGNGTIIYASKAGGVSIGSNTMIAAQCYIIDTDHGIEKGTPMRKQSNVVSSIRIGEDVWIAAGAKILKGSRLEDGCIVGAQSVVKGCIPPNAIAVGVPARTIRYRE